MHTGDIFGISMHCSDKIVTTDCHRTSATPIPDPKTPEKNEIVSLCCAKLQFNLMEVSTELQITRQILRFLQKLTTTWLSVMICEAENGQASAIVSQTFGNNMGNTMGKGKL
jgi:hypothetical protein